VHAKTILTLLFVISLCVVAILGVRALPQRVNDGPPVAKDETLVATMALLQQCIRKRVVIPIDYDSDFRC